MTKTAVVQVDQDQPDPGIGDEAQIGDLEAKVTMAVAGAILTIIVLAIAFARYL